MHLFISFCPPELLGFWFQRWLVVFVQNFIQEMRCLGISLAVQWLRLCLSMQGVWVRSLVGELRSHMPCGRKGKI